MPGKWWAQLFKARVVEHLEHVGPYPRMGDIPLPWGTP
jgi:hypothetical protein